MKSEPTLLVEAVRLVAFVAATFGIAINAEDQAAAVVGLGALFAFGSVVLAWWNRRKVYAPATVQKIANAAAASGRAIIGTPPKGAA